VGCFQFAGFEGIILGFLFPSIGEKSLGGTATPMRGGQVFEPVLRSKNTWGKGALSLLRFFRQVKK
jgi:PPE-repeat protein